MEKDGNYQRIWKEIMEGKKIAGIQEQKGFLYIYKGRKQQTTGGWRLIILRNFNLKGMSAIETLLHEAHDQTGHGGFLKTYSYLQDKYSWIGQHQDTKEFVSTRNICQLSKGITQLLVGLLTPLAVPQRPWTTVSTDFLSIVPIKVFLTDILPGYRPEKGESLHKVTFHKLMVIQDILTDYTFLIPYTSYITAKDVIEMWKQKVAPIVGLPHALISDQDPLFMSREFQEWL